MKAIFPGLPLLDAAGKELGESQAGGDTQDAVQGFDALLALVAAQSAAAAQLSQPVKPLAPSVGAQAPVAAPNQGSAKAPTAAPLELVAPQMDAAMYSIQGTLFTSALDAAGAPLPAQLALPVAELADAVAVDVAEQPAPAASPSVVQPLPAADTAQPESALTQAQPAPIAQPQLSAQPAPLPLQESSQEAPAAGSDVQPLTQPATSAASAPFRATEPSSSRTPAAPVAQTPPRSAPMSEAASVESRPLAHAAQAAARPVLAPAADAAPSQLEQVASSQELPTPAAPSHELPAPAVVSAPAPSQPGADVRAPQLPPSVDAPTASATAPVVAQPVALPELHAAVPFAASESDPLLQTVQAAPVQEQPLPALAQPAAPSAQPSTRSAVESAPRAVSVTTPATTPATAPITPTLDVVELNPPLEFHARVARAVAAAASDSESAPALVSEQPAQLAVVTVPQPMAASPSAQPAAPAQPTAAVSAATRPAPVTAAPARVVDPASLVGMRDSETGATVTRVEFFQAPAPAAPAPAAQPQPVAVVNTPVAAASAAQVSALQPNPVRVSVSAQSAIAAPLAAQPATELEADVSAPLALDAAPLSIEAAPEQAPAAGTEELEANAHTARDGSSEQDESAPREQSQEGQGADAKPQAQPAAPQVAFQPSDAHGMRGLDAVVASLLRTGAPEAEAAAPTVRGPARANLELGKVETAKSDSTKSAEKLSLQSGAQKERALAREEERQNLREALELEPAHQFHAEPKPDLAPTDAPTDAAPVPLPSPQLVQDPDAALMGKIARGEGVNAAAISIDHPDFGAMDLVVESANGRIDVRAVLETPKAAAVMRAQESALRYGIQQAGMTFGALRVRSRGEEPTQLKARDNAKSSRRPGHEWEA